MKPPQKPPTLNIDPATLLLVIVAFLLIPLLVTGFWAQ